MKRFKWSQAKSESTLAVELDYAFDPKVADRFPGIYVGTGDIDYRQVVIANQNSYTKDRAGSNSIIEGGSTIILRHASLQPDECLQLGELSFGFFTGIREMLIERMRLKTFDVKRLSTPRFFNPDSTAEADKKYFSDLVIGIAFNAAWTTFRESHRIKTITFGETLNEFDEQKNS